MIYLVSLIIFCLLLYILSSLFLFGDKFSKNKKRIRILEKRLLWRVPTWLTIVYAATPSRSETLIRRIKNSLIEKQLLFLLGELSSNLTGGICVSETINSILNEIQPPLKNELSVYIMISKEHGSIKALEHTISKSNNVFLRMFFVMLLNNVKNGGAIAESIKKLQKMLFTRTNIQQRIKAQLMQTKIQIIAGTILPYFMFAIMNFLYKDLIQAVFHSAIGIGMLLAAMTLHIIGVLLFVKICKFNMNKELTGSMLFEYMAFSLKNGISIKQGFKEAKEAGLVDTKIEISASSSTSELIHQLCDNKERYTKSLALILKKGHSLGISISEDLSLQAQDIMEKLEQRAIRFQQVAPAKALIPMLFCIFPATYLMILAPVLVQVLN